MGGWGVGDWLDMAHVFVSDARPTDSIISGFRGYLADAPIRSHLEVPLVAENMPFLHFYGLRA